MKLQFLLPILAAFSLTSASAALQCGHGESKVVVKYDTLGGLTRQAFKDISFDSADSRSNALSRQTARPIPAGTVACKVDGDGFFDDAAHLNVAGQPVDYWVQDRAVTPAD
ncbi:MULTISPECIES: hypothetical protein [Paraburkholderia]|uniref:Uncharacterized protein n=1 Tax=Paraburkholderia madseniana TaxID=2599607 RepID=A0AAP5BPJ1_9BURK|nr:MULTISPECIES: hypothetical protein [Paraburkholderia]MCX4151966.1 hypothetical protein [Paraburkholderia madseniana]MCX4175615.1 hypothetical protein [Paraburkholderia madseniana]MDN7154894.1 hypothetical protein [Paraburkholderia sp. WS6]MDQ6413777.1 hypothetical protein [Paraburkholderia madseniana]MDQ6463611.1 hypothetical protein [Paraburkholderia madseniana]